jgi:hypothetical protein
MRRKAKYITTGAVVAGGLAAVIDIIVQWLEKKENSEKLTWNNYDGKRTLKWIAVGAIVGGASGYLYYEYKISEEEKMPFNSDEYLKKVLAEENIKADPDYLKKVLKKRTEMKDWLIEEFGFLMVNGRSEDAGSFSKRTAINSKFDCDIVLPFKKDSYNTLKEMYYDVYERICRKFGNIARVQKQTKGIEVILQAGCDEIYFDIVPGREINNYAIEKDLNLYVRPDWVWQRGKSFKTNISLQKRLTINKPEARRAIKLLKAYRDRNAVNIPTVIIEQSVVKALENNNYGVQYSDTENLLNSMEFIAKKVSVQNIVDVANTNNNLSAKLSTQDRNRISDLLIADVERISNNPRFITEIFEC